MISHQLWIKISCNSLKTIARRNSLGQSKLKVIFSTFNLGHPNKVELFNILHFFLKLKKQLSISAVKNYCTGYLSINYVYFVFLPFLFLFFSVNFVVRILIQLNS